MVVSAWNRESNDHKDDMLLGHPKGLTLLFMTEMWERYGFYTIRVLLVLYLVGNIDSGGMGWTKKEALNLYGTFMAFAYITPIIGGYLSDRFMGQQLSAIIGGAMMAAGHLTMAFNEVWALYAALTLIAIGSGFFKPCLTSILGQLYDDSDESQRDSAYSLFYMGINIGAMLAGIISGWLREHYGYDYGFIIAGIGMILGLGVFWFGKGRYLEGVGLKPQVKVKNHHVVPLTREEKSRLGIVVILFLITVLFVAAWEGGGLITLFIDENINRTIGNFKIPTPWLANLDPMMIIFLAPTLSFLWSRLGDKGKDPYLGNKMGIGCFSLCLSFIVLGYMAGIGEQPDDVLPSWKWILLNKFFATIGELCVIPISWAAVTRLSPESYVSRMMGLMLAGIGIGSYFAGWIGSFVDEVGPKAIFDSLTMGLVILTIACLALNPIMKRMSHGLH